MLQFNLDKLATIIVPSEDPISIFLTQNRVFSSQDLALAPMNSFWIMLLVLAPILLYELLRATTLARWATLRDLRFVNQLKRADLRPSDYGSFTLLDHNFHNFTSLQLLRLFNHQAYPLNLTFDGISVLVFFSVFFAFYLDFSPFSMAHSHWIHYYGFVLIVNFSFLVLNSNLLEYLLGLKSNDPYFCHSVSWKKFQQ